MMQIPVSIDIGDIGGIATAGSERDPQPPGVTNPKPLNQAPAVVTAAVDHSSEQPLPSEHGPKRTTSGNSMSFVENPHHHLWFPHELSRWPGPKRDSIDD